MNVDDVLELLDGVRKAGDGWTAKCPAHDDAHNSLSIAVGNDDRVLLHCHAGCAFGDIAAALKADESSFFADERGPDRRVVATYDYRDENGKVLFEVVRFAPKDFRPRRPDAAAKGGWAWNLNGTRRVLFHLPELLAAMKAGRPIFVVEGEKDVLALERLGLVATTNAGGANGWRSEYAEPLRGADVIVLPDHDEAGRKHGAAVVKSLAGNARSVRLLELPGLPEHGDVSDWLEAGGTREELERLAVPAAAVEAPKLIHSLADVVAMIRPRRPFLTFIEWLDKRTGGGLSRGDSAVIGGAPGTFKTTLAVQIACALAEQGAAVCFVAWDEGWLRVARKLGSHFGEMYSELNGEYAIAVTRLRDRLARRSLEVFLPDPASGATFEQIAAAFATVASPDRQWVYIVDMLQVIDVEAGDDDDAEPVAVRKAVDSLLSTTKKQDAILIALSETTKAALSLDAIEACPMAAFAGSRRIASRFDLPIVMAKTGDLVSRLYVPKNRLGPTGRFALRLDPDRWKLTAEEEMPVAEVKSNRAREQAEKDDAAVLEILRTKGPLHCDALEAEARAAGLKRIGIRHARERLVTAGTVVTVDGPKRAGRGPAPVLYTLKANSRQLPPTAAETAAGGSDSTSETTAAAAAPLKGGGSSYGESRRKTKGQKTGNSRRRSGASR